MLLVLFACIATRTRRLAVAASCWLSPGPRGPVLVATLSDQHFWPHPSTCSTLRFRLVRLSFFGFLDDVAATTAVHSSLLSRIVFQYLWLVTSPRPTRAAYLVAEGMYHWWVFTDLLCCLAEVFNHAAQTKAT